MANNTNGASKSSAIHFDKADIARFANIFQGREDHQQKVREANIRRQYRKKEE